jgi:hypothetical protein
LGATQLDVVYIRCGADGGNCPSTSFPSQSGAAASGQSVPNFGVDGDRAAVIARHARWLRDQHHLLRALDELRGNKLLCFCAPVAAMAICRCGAPTATREERIAWWRSAV